MIIYKYSNDNVNFDDVYRILGLAFSGRNMGDVEKIKESFLNSSNVIYCYDGEELIGFARAISDTTWAVIYNVALNPKYQGRGIGKEIINRLVESLKGKIIFTYTHPRTISLYEHLGFNRSKMAFKYVGNIDDERVNFQAKAGFFLDNNYHFDTDLEKEKKKNNEEIINIRYSSNLNDTSILEINNLLEEAFNHKRDITKTKEDFKLSSHFVFAFDGDKLIGLARLLSDRVGEAILLNVAVLPKYQGFGIAGEIINKLCDNAKDYDIFIHTHPNALHFYNSSLKYRRYKTAFSYIGNNEYDPNFFLPNGYRFEDEENSDVIKYYKGKILN